MNESFTPSPYYREPSWDVNVRWFFVDKIGPTVARVGAKFSTTQSIFHYFSPSLFLYTKRRVQGHTTLSFQLQLPKEHNNKTKTMGGDDLEDDYLIEQVEDGGASVSSSSSSDDDEPAGVPETKKRKLMEESSSSSNHEQQHQEEEPVISSKKQKRRDIEKARNLEEKDAKTQAKFLSEWLGKSVTPQQVATNPSLESNPTMPFFQRIQPIISKKKLKQWNPNDGSPMVIIVCLSARRAVQVLKELSVSKLRVAKLFAKHMSIDQQKELLTSSGSKFSLAVGTPHRLLQLAQAGALTLAKTQLVVLDAHVNPKNFSVYTLPDTEASTKEFLKKCILPELKGRTTLRMAVL